MIAGLARLLGYDGADRIESWRAAFGAAWAHESPALVLFLCLAATALAGWFYLRGQIRGRRASRLGLAMVRGTLLAVMILMIADPVLELTLVVHPRPTLWLLFDGSDSMAIRDELPRDEAAQLQVAVNWKQFVAQPPANHSERPPRADYVRALLSNPDANLLARLSERFRLEAFVFADSEGSRRLLLTTDSEANKLTSQKGRELATAWTTDGTTTAIGDALTDLSTRQATENLAGVVVFSDFEQNAGTAPLSAAHQLGVPLFTVGVGPRQAVDLSVELQTPPTLKKSEESNIAVIVRQQGSGPPTVEVRLSVQSLPQNGSAASAPQLIGARTVAFTEGIATVEFPYAPDEAGRCLLTAEVDLIDGEVVLENNRVERRVRVIDDFLRLLYVEYEPSWEWRFVKEVFHRDKLVGLRGFRTFLSSADPVVRETNELFLQTLTLPRSEFFQFDVLFLGDMPGSTLSPRFCEMVKEFVGQFGGGLVVIAGPRFGPGQLAATPLADMLPVVVDPSARRQDDQDFRLRLTPFAEHYDFMRLGGAGGDDHEDAWRNLGELPWYQPVLRPAALGTTVLAEHPTDLCADGETRQPLIAVRKYGRGEVVYLGFNELWRLRRLYGEEHYRQFWGQLIYRLGLSHTLGGHKRFVARTDKQSYRLGDEVMITVDAYDANFQPLTESALPDRRLPAELRVHSHAGSAPRDRSLSLGLLRPGVFAARVPANTVGEHVVSITDPIDQETVEVSFDVSEQSLERRSAVRNVALQQRLADETGGRAYELTDVSRLADEFSPPPRSEKSVEIVPLWSNWLCFAVVISLMITEWLARKLMNLA